jgi:multidrug efflux pump
LLGVLTIVVGFVFLKSIALLLGATPETLEYVNEYLRIIILGAPAIILSFSLGQLVRAEGSAKLPWQE